MPAPPPRQLALPAPAPSNLPTLPLTDVKGSQSGLSMLAKLDEKTRAAEKEKKEAAEVEQKQGEEGTRAEEQGEEGTKAEDSRKTLSQTAKDMLARVQKARQGQFDDRKVACPTSLKACKVFGNYRV